MQKQLPDTALTRVGRAGMLCVLGLLLTACGALVTSPPPALTATGSTAVARTYPTPQATTTLYSNSLTQQASGWAAGSTCAFTSKGLAVQPSSGQAYICLAPLNPPADLAITVTVQQTTGSVQHAFGIAFRHSAPKNYYFFGIDTHGRFTLTVVVNDVKHPVLPFTANAAIHQGINATNQLQIIVKGNLVTMLVNGSPVGQATLTTFASGGVGLRGINDGVVVFRQLTIAPV